MTSRSHREPSRSPRANRFVGSDNICMPLSSLLYSHHGKCFSFLAPVFTGMVGAAPPRAGHRNQIDSGLSTRLVRNICLRQTLRDPPMSLTSVHKYNPIKFNLGESTTPPPRPPHTTSHCFLNAINENKPICLVLIYIVYNSVSMEDPGDTLASSPLFI